MEWKDIPKEWKRIVLMKLSTMAYEYAAEPENDNCRALTESYLAAKRELGKEYE